MYLSFNENCKLAIYLDVVFDTGSYLRRFRGIIGSKPKPLLSKSSMLKIPIVRVLSEQVDCVVKIFN